MSIYTTYVYVYVYFHVDIDIDIHIHIYIHILYVPYLLYLLALNGFLFGGRHD